MSLLSLAWIGSAVFVPLHVLRAEEPDTSVKKTTQGNYGRTPDTVIPYREFHQPYVRFFQEVTAFRGYGRDAQNAGLPETVRIGVLAPTGSAPDADLGQEMIDGITLAIEQANAGGGYQGIPFETVLRRDAGLWGGTANEMVAFKFHDDVVGVLGSIDGANTHIALRVALKAQVPMLNTATTDPTLTETAIPWLMRCMADDRQQGYALAHHIFSKCEIKKVAALRVNDRYGRTGIAEFRDAARRLKHPLRLELRWDRGDRDFSKQLDRIAQTGAEAVVLWGNAEDTAAVVQEMRRRNMPQLIFGCDRLVSRRFLEIAGEAADGVVAVATYNPTELNPRYTEFLKAFQKRFDREPDSFAAHAYDGANILIESIRKGGLNRIRVRDALHEYDRYAGVTGLIEFDTTLNDIGSVYIATVTDGDYVYERADFSKSARSAPGAIPYRTLADSPPVARVAQVADNERIPKAHRIGCFLPLDTTGESVVRGLRMALAQLDTLSGEVPIELIVRDSRGVWGDNGSALTSLVANEDVLALVGSTERRGTHLMETMVAKLHVPLITLCGDDPTIHAIPLSWIFSVAPAGDIVDENFVRRFELRYGTAVTREAAMGYDAGQLLLSAIRGGGTTRAGLRKQLATAACRTCVSGSFRFDALGRRVDFIDVTPMATLEETNSVIGMTRVDNGREGSP
jgi:ABC-type branched-subunit amino acid transport system substrate-binding protein